MSLVRISDLTHAHLADRAAEWLWVLPAWLAPDPAADALLLAHAGGPAGPALLAGRVCDAAGRTLPAWLPHGPEDDPDRVLAALPARTLPLRRCRPVHLLVHRRALDAVAPPQPGRFGAHAGEEWCARALRSHPGLYVPASVARAAGAPPVGGRDPRAARGALAAARAGAWTRGEALRMVADDIRGRG